ncbi:MAG TPA: GNAT family N-acetyltransferase [Terracidiphilus sp.]|jgi:ribosomal protein S18 acetylase RimI-like enzyme
MILIRRAEPYDAAGIAHVHVQSWRSTYAGIVPGAYLDSLNEEERAEHWKSLLGEELEVFVAEREGNVIGFVAGGRSRDRAQHCDGELYAIYLLKDDQRLKIGRDLVRELAHALKRRGFRKMEVWVLAKNPAKAFYTRMGAQFGRSRQIEIGGVTLMESAYFWPDLDMVSRRYVVSRS